MERAKNRVWGITFMKSRVTIFPIELLSLSLRKKKWKAYNRHHVDKIEKHKVYKGARTKKQKSQYIYTSPHIILHTTRWYAFCKNGLRHIPIIVFITYVICPPGRAFFFFFHHPSLCSCVSRVFIAICFDWKNDSRLFIPIACWSTDFLCPRMICNGATTGDLVYIYTSREIDEILHVLAENCLCMFQRL